MRIRVRHQTTYSYAKPARRLSQRLRLTPRGHAGQQVVGWRVGVDLDCALVAGEDAFGNVVHRLEAPGPVDAVTIVAEGAVDVSDSVGLVRGAPECFPPELYMRASPLAHADAAIAEFAADVARGRRDRLDRLHALMSSLNARMAFDPDATHVATSAPEAFALRRGVCQDFAHVFLAAARLMDAPARYVAGYYLRADGVEEPAGHAWTEAYVDDLGWVGFDATHGVCPGERHVRVAIGLDYLDAAPVRGVRDGGGEESLGVALKVTDAAVQQHQ